MFFFEDQVLITEIDNKKYLHFPARGCNTKFTFVHGFSHFLFRKALVQFSCDPGYELKGSYALSCDGRNWNDTIPHCASE